MKKTILSVLLLMVCSSVFSKSGDSLYILHSARPKSDSFISPESQLQNWLNYAPIWIPLLILIAQQLFKNRSERLNNQLIRLNNQLSELYGPLYALHEVGSANFYSYKSSGKEDSFLDPEYSLWLNQVFMLTNNEMERIITKSAALFVGKMPSVYIIFCKHVAALKTCLSEVNKGNLDKSQLRSLDLRMREHQHPGDSFYAYVVESFNCLKEKQVRLLSTMWLLKLVDEGKLYKHIQVKAEKKLIILNTTNLVKARLHLIPMTSDRRNEPSYNRLIESLNIKYEIIKSFVSSSTPDIIDDDLNSTEEIEYNENGSHKKKIIRNNKFHEFIVVKNYLSTKGLSEKQILYNPDKSIEAWLKFEYTDRNRTRLSYFNSTNRLEFKIDYKFDNEGNEIEYSRMDRKGNLIEHVERISDSEDTARYQWFNPKTNELIQECTITQWHGYLAERKDSYCKHNRTDVVTYAYEIDVNKLAKKVVRRGLNDNKDFIRQHSYITFKEDTKNTLTAYATIYWK